MDRIDAIDVLPAPRRRESQYGHIDEMVKFSHSGQTYTLVIELKSNAAPQIVRRAALQLKGLLVELGAAERVNTSRLLPMLVATYLSPEARQICKSHEIAYLDLFDNAYLRFDDVYVDWATPDKPKSETLALRSIFKPKAAAVLRAILRNPGRAWRVAELSEESNASLGHMSNVCKSLLEREWVERTSDGVVLVRPSDLLSAWR